MADWLTSLCTELEAEGVRQATGYPLLSFSQYDRAPLILGMYTRVIGVTRCTDEYNTLVQVWEHTTSNVRDLLVTECRVNVPTYLVHAEVSKVGSLAVIREQMVTDVPQRGIAGVVMSYLET